MCLMKTRKKNYKTELSVSILYTDMRLLLRLKDRILQGYVYFHNPRSISGVIKDIQGAHIEIAKGAPDQNFDYCSKDGLFFERGKRPMSQKEKRTSRRDTLARCSVKLLLLVILLASLMICILGIKVHLSVFAERT